MCATLLSAYNPGPFCWTHTLDMSETARPARHVSQRRRKQATPPVEINPYPFPHDDPYRFPEGDEA